MSQPRRSSRLKVKPALNFVEEPTSAPEESGFEDYDEEDTRPVKRRKRQHSKKVTSKPVRKNVKGRRGKLAKLPEMPLDLLFEVALFRSALQTPSEALHRYSDIVILDSFRGSCIDTYLLVAPLDLLHLAWTTKALRDVLMSRHSITIWRQALSAYEGLPSCPPELNEPQYTRLAFDHHCYVRHVFL